MDRSNKKRNRRIHPPKILFKNLNTTFLTFLRSVMVKQIKRWDRKTISRYSMINSIRSILFKARDKKTISRDPTMKSLIGRVKSVLLKP